MRLWVPLITLFFLLYGCQEDDKRQGSGDVISGGDEVCEVPERNRELMGVMEARYFWREEMPEGIVPESYSDTKALLGDLRNEQDHWSYLTTVSDSDGYYIEGKYLGVGISFRTEAGGFRVLFSYPGSPAADAGVDRGDLITHIDGAEVNASSTFGADENGTVVSLRLKEGESLREVNVTKTYIAIDTVPYFDVIDLDGGSRAGYLVFTDFISAAEANLTTVFERFKEANVSELILDLRYNGGGYIWVAKLLDQLIAGNGIAGKRFVTYQSSYTGDSYSYFDSAASSSYGKSLGIDTLTVLTTGSTCSASELVVNTLRPYLETVRLVGETTCGKPFGMTPYDLCDNWVVYPITYKLLNADGEAEYQGGMSPDCTVEDTVAAPFGSMGDPVLASALEALEGKGDWCPAAVAKAVQTKRPQGGAVPPPWELRR